jgi:hypothetical protein
MHSEIEMRKVHLSTTAREMRKVHLCTTARAVRAPMPFASRLEFFIIGRLAGTKKSGTLLIAKKMNDNVSCSGDLQVYAQLQGDELLPWEGARFTPEMQKRLGRFKDPVLKLLCRDPYKRPSMREFCARCSRIFANTTVTQSGTYDT